MSCRCALTRGEGSEGQRLPSDSHAQGVLLLQRSLAARHEYRSRDVLALSYLLEGVLRWLERAGRTGLASLGPIRQSGNWRSQPDLLVFEIRHGLRRLHGLFLRFVSH